MLSLSPWYSIQEQHSHSAIAEDQFLHSVGYAQEFPLGFQTVAGSRSADWSWRGTLQIGCPRRGADGPDHYHHDTVANGPQRD